MRLPTVGYNTYLYDSNGHLGYIIRHCSAQYQTFRYFLVFIIFLNVEWALLADNHCLHEPFASTP